MILCISNKNAWGGGGFIEPAPSLVSVTFFYVTCRMVLETHCILHHSLEIQYGDKVQQHLRFLCFLFDFM